MTAHKGKKIRIDSSSDSDEGSSGPEMDEEVASEAASGTTPESDAGSPDETVKTGSFSPKIVEPKGAGPLEPDDVDMDAEMGALLDEEEAKAREQVLEEKDKALADAQQAARDAQDKFLRLQAEWNNYRKRSATERDDERKRATEHFVKDLLPVVDDFERALAHAEGANDIDSLKEGIDAVHTKLLDVLVKEKVEIIDPVGEAFDANRHQAVGTAEDDSLYDETVKQVYQKGYAMGGHVIRPAMVIVSTGGKTRPVEDDSADAATAGDENVKDPSDGGTGEERPESRENA